jgi:integrase
MPAVTSGDRAHRADVEIWRVCGGIRRAPARSLIGSQPRGVSAGQDVVLLASCDRDSAAGRRNYTILLLLTRLGLRTGEVIGITMDDIDWGRCAAW